MFPRQTKRRRVGVDMGSLIDGPWMVRCQMGEELHLKIGESLFPQGSPFLR